MGFFKDFKNDMKQAVNELIPGNDEVANEYDDEDMVNTLDEDMPEDIEEEYINTMDEEIPGSDAQQMDAGQGSDGDGMEDLEDIDLTDLEDFDMADADFDEEEDGYRSDMDSLADLLSGNIQVEDLENQDVYPPAEPETAPEDALNHADDNVLLAHSEQLEADYQDQYGSEEDVSDSDIPIDDQNLKDSADHENQNDYTALEDALKEQEEAGMVADQQPLDQTLNDQKDEEKEPETAEVQAAEEPEIEQKEDANMAEDNVINITSIKEPEPVEDAAAIDPVKASLEAEGVSDSTTYITKGTRIEGNLFTDGSLDILGTVEGDVNCYGKLIISGGITGKVNAGEIYANAAKIEGEVTSAGSVKIGVGSVIIGNIDSQSAVIAGAVNGDLDVKGPVIVDSTAVIMGNIKSRSVQINNGAVIEGFCSQCYSDIDVKSFFA